MLSTPFKIVRHYKCVIFLTKDLKTKTIECYITQKGSILNVYTFGKILLKDLSYLC